jgi:hypothetical protein
MPSTSSVRRRREDVPRLRRGIPRQPAARHPHPRAGGFRQAHRGLRSRRPGREDLPRHRPQGRRAHRQAGEDRSGVFPKIVIQNTNNEHQERQVDPADGRGAQA